MIKAFEEGIWVLVPKYTETGDSTYIYTAKGRERLYPMTLRTFLRKLYYFYTIDLLAQRNKFKKMGIHQNAPLVLKNEVFIKVRVRRPIGKSDGAYGYVNVKAVKGINQLESSTEVILADGYRIQSLDSYATLSKNLVLGQTLEASRKKS